MRTCWPWPRDCRASRHGGPGRVRGPVARGGTTPGRRARHARGRSRCDARARARRRFRWTRGRPRLHACPAAPVGDAASDASRRWAASTRPSGASAWSRTWPTRAVARGMRVSACLDAPAERRGTPRRVAACARTYGSSWRVRNGLISASATMAPARVAGRTYAAVASLAFADAWRHAGIASGSIAFRRALGRAARGAGALASAGPASRDALWPARTSTAAVLPILAIDASSTCCHARAGPGVRHRLPGEAHRARAAPADATVRQPTSTRHRAAAAEEPAVEPDHGSSAGDARAAMHGRLLHRGRSACRYRDRLDTLSRSRSPRSSSSTGTGASTSRRASGASWPATTLPTASRSSASTTAPPTVRASCSPSRFPWVHVVALPENRGFTGGNVAGVAAARGDVLRVLQQRHAGRAGRGSDARRRAGRRAPVRGRRGPQLERAPHRLRPRHRSTSRPAGSRTTTASPGAPERAASVDTFFPNGGAFAITRAGLPRRRRASTSRSSPTTTTWTSGSACGSNGGRIRVVHDALVYHRHGATSRQYPARAEALPDGAQRPLDRAQALRGRDARSRAGRDPAAPRAAPRAGDWSCAGESAWVRALAPLLDPLPQARARRRAAPSLGDYAPGASREAGRRGQSAGASARDADRVARRGRARRCAGLPGAEVSAGTLQARATRDRLRGCCATWARPLEYGSPLDVLPGRAGRAARHRSASRASSAGGRDVLIITHEPLRKRMSGPGVRALELGRALARVGCG